MKYFKYILFFIFIGTIYSCSKDDNTLEASNSDIFPEQPTGQLDSLLKETFSKYNIVVQYRYVKNFLPNDWYDITPVRDTLVMPMAHFLEDFWIKNLIEASDFDFVKTTLPRKLIFVGSPARRLNGSTVLGQAEGGAIITFTEVNNSASAAKQTQLHTAFHEYSHIIHQMYNLPDAFREVTPESYTKNGWMALKANDAIKLGMVTPYGTSAVHEDFAELFSTYICAPQDVVDHILKDDEPTDDTTPAQMKEIIKMNEGRALIRKKLAIMKQYLKSLGFDLDIAREKTREKLDSLPKN